MSTWTEKSQAIPELIQAGILASVYRIGWRLLKRFIACWG